MLFASALDFAFLAFGFAAVLGFDAALLAFGFDAALLAFGFDAALLAFAFTALAFAQIFFGGASSSTNSNSSFDFSSIFSSGFAAFTFFAAFGFALTAAAGRFFGEAGSVSSFFSYHYENTKARQWWETRTTQQWMKNNKF